MVNVNLALKIYFYEAITRERVIPGLSYMICIFLIYIATC